ncbi:hypothetical protein M422DRAFT_61717 [Sphaerobolus stellatus SS14]|uniref:Unplaced genomic scaffold SPHSTscaffold_186, whole genome shotgun sequence n=1 Tax=Sphaerobolus stellatus (strain SS14) TaxID=990650 RepID=A0A0C9UYI9_SPHS4|nr:hypothetical protein M422DRAFT_61717 [Sphaerobolus stellatus SS14]
MRPLFISCRPRNCRSFTLSSRSLHDWRTRASSRRKPGGLIDPPGEQEIAPYNRKRRSEQESTETALKTPYTVPIENYKAKYLDLLTAERDAEVSLIRSRIKEWPLEKLQRAGYNLSDLSAFWLPMNEFGRHVAAFLLGPGMEMPKHRFECAVLLLLLDLSNTDISYERMVNAIFSFAADPVEQEANPSDDQGRDIAIQGTHLRDILLKPFSGDEPLPEPEHPSRGAFFEDQRIQSWIRRHSVPGEPLVVEGDPPLDALNATQRRAVAFMLGERLSLIQGPPGTGKTKTIVEAVNLLKAYFQVPQPLLVCTYTNVAVDNLVEGLVKRGLKPLRVGYSAKMKKSIEKYTLDAQMDEHALKSEYDDMKKSIDDLRMRIAALQKKIDDVDKNSAYASKMTGIITKMRTDLKRIYSQRWLLRMRMVQDIVHKSDVALTYALQICTTCIASATSNLTCIDFPVIFLDEASMSTEPASLIPLMKGSRHVSLIGDHRQLAPVITSSKAKAGGLNVSLFERLIKETSTPTVMLDRQYRMHPTLSRFPSSEFYNFALFDGTVGADGSIHPRLLPPTSTHLEVNPATGDRPSVIFLDHAGNEALKDRSRVNLNEARLVCAVIEDLLMHNPKMRGLDIGVITPYAAQVSLLQRKLGYDRSYQGELERLLGPLRAMQVADIEVKTVDGFEGREKDVIIFSTVRNNAAGQIGFLADRRRMNVGLTRAKRALFVIGSVGTLGPKHLTVGSPTRTAGTTTTTHAERQVWVRYLEWLGKNGAVKMLRGQQLERMLQPRYARI